MDELLKLKELVSSLKKKNPAIDDDDCVSEVIALFKQWKPFFDEELNHWKSKAEELVSNFK